MVSLTTLTSKTSIKPLQLGRSFLGSVAYPPPALRDCGRMADQKANTRKRLLQPDCTRSLAPKGIWLSVAKAGGTSAMNTSVVHMNVDVNSLPLPENRPLEHELPNTACLSLSTVEIGDECTVCRKRIAFHASPPVISGHYDVGL